MLCLTCIIVSSVDLAHYGVYCAKDWVSVDCDTMSYIIHVLLFLSFFSATIARNKDRFWVNVQSEPILDRSLSTVPTKICPALQTKYDTTLNTAAHAFVPTLTIVTALMGAFFA